MKKPLWSGPEEDGITQSLLSRFLCCRERFRLLVIEGLKPVDSFNHLMEYGQIWHAAEETLAAGDNFDDALNTAADYCQGLIVKYRESQVQIEKWYNVCRVQFPVYVEYWKKHPDVKARTPLFQEEVFCVPYTLPSGRVVKLRGKWDSVDLIGKGRNAGIYLQENKTKSDIKEQQLVRQLGFDLQTMLYLVALGEWHKQNDRLTKPNYPIKGVRYNVIRRPLSGGKGSIRQHKPTKKKPEGETADEYYARLQAIIEAEPETYFMRWKVEVIKQDIDKFKREFLNPILEQLCDWYTWVAICYRSDRDPFIPHGGLNEETMHWRNPYGIWNPQLEGRASEMDEFLATGSMVGLQRTDTLFGELA